MNKIQHVQYECIKSELKEEYEKKIKFLDKKLERNQANNGPYKEVQQIFRINNINDSEIFNHKSLKREMLKSSVDIKRDKLISSKQF